ncbi:MAG: hypothetical protein JSV49_11465 [Thermoplasmata archaeon]|nr:MAG: hypothetical protein JSV49_11465 [Thermoplasmata archaeon]
MTNAEDNDNVDVLVTIDKLDEIDAEVLHGGTVVTNKKVTLAPRIPQDLYVRVTADEHQPAGDYRVTFKVMDESGATLLNSTEITTTVAQFYDIEIEKISTESYSRVVDPNSMTSDIQTETFEVNILNYGNDDDTVTIEWAENRLSPEPIPLAWEDALMEIYDKDGGTDTITEIKIDAYNDLTGQPGEVTLQININIPKENVEGIFMIDLVVTSSAPRNYITNLQRDFQYEDNTTFVISMVLPDVSINVDESMLRKDGTKINEPDSIYTNDKIELYIVIDNEGSAPATDVKIKFSATKDQVEQQSKEDDFTVGAGEQIIMSWNFTPTEAGYYTFKVEIDPSKELLGDHPNDNSWSKFKEVKQEETDNGENGNGGGSPLSITGEGGGINPVFLILIIVVIIVVVAVVFFFFMQKKKGEEEEIEDITMVGAPMGAPGAMPPGMQAPGGMMAGPPGGPGMGPGMPQRQMPMGGPAVGAAPDVKALSPAAPKQLPPAAAGAAAAGKKCPSCGESNPPENKFCQGCGGKL